MGQKSSHSSLIVLPEKPHIYTIDPGITGAGMALWESETWPNLCNPNNVWVISPRGKTWLDRSWYMMEKMAAVISWNRDLVDRVYCEFPEFFDDELGHMAAKSGRGSEPGALQKLTFHVGNVAGMCRMMSIPFIPVLVREWKGQLPKEVIKRRIQRALPTVDKLQIASHGWDAVGIGLWAKGHGVGVK